MEHPLAAALRAGVERLAAWADLLDEINVFPVADGDTGRNLVVTLAPLRRDGRGREALTRELLMAARGNAGNIAARFLSGLLAAGDPGELAGAAREGSERAWRAVQDPQPGTMLTLFDALAEALETAPTPGRESGADGGEGDGRGAHVAAGQDGADDGWCGALLARLAAAVRSTPELLPRLKAAGVVDAGALGGYLFLEGFFASLAGRGDLLRPLTETFPGMLRLSPDFRAAAQGGCCIDAVLKVGAPDAALRERIAAAGESVVMVSDGEWLKVHLHARDGERARGALAALGEVVRFSADDLEAQTGRFRGPRTAGALHVMTDAAGSLTRETAAELGVTLLESYITLAGRSWPETRLAPGELYGAMRRGERASTAQASAYERRQCYQSVLARHPRVLYLAVGSAYTGNVAAALAWKAEHDREERLTVIDTGAASGRLGLLALAVARFARESGRAEAVVDFAREAAERCAEYVFLERLEYLAAGGRLSRPGAFMGDLLGMKPVITPLAGGAKRAGVVRDREGQLTFALDRLAAGLAADPQAPVLLQHTDNEAWVAGTVRPEIARRHPRAELLLAPMSLTAGAHMGPGTWAVAFLPFAGGGAG